MNVAHEDLSEEIIKEFHRILKRATSDERKEWFRVGEYKARPNVVGVEDIVDFHHEFESIHPFQDGNGRVGRILMFKECLKHDIMPFIIIHEHKQFYYRGLKEYRSEKGYLMDTCLSAQDRYRALVDYFFPD